jgi:prevent-host-death family protein
MESIGAYEAKTNLSQLLDRVARGEEIRITRHGRPIARLVPEAGDEPADIRAVIAEIKELRKGQRLGKGLTIRQLIEEGRRF